MSEWSLPNEIRRTITINDFDNNRWPAGYLARETEYCINESKEFRKASKALEKAREAVLNKRMEFYSIWWLNRY